VASVTVLALLAVALFALLVGRVVHDQITDQAFDRATDTAEVLARASFAPRLPVPGDGLSPRDLAELDRQLAAARGGEPLLDMRLWARGGRVLYARERRLVGRRAAPPEPVAAALAGRTASEVVEGPGSGAEGRGGDGDASGAKGRGGGGDAASEASGDDADDRVLLTAVPVVRRAGARPAAALELALPYGPVAADVDRRTRRLVVALVAVALLVYLLSLPALLRAARALRAHYDPRRVQLVRELRRAMARGELELHFQPIAGAASRRPHSAEALVRWRYPPDRFIPIVEPTEVMWPFTLHVLDLAIAACAGWRAEGNEIAVAVNVSGGVLHDRRLGPEVRRMLDRHGLPPAALQVEVTEGAVMRDPDAAAGILRELTGFGISVIAIDDFGTGYSSLARLHELPLDTLKIDQSFVARMARDGDASIVCSIVELAHALGLKVIAEGAEDEATIERLASLGCDYVQGYGLTPPLPPDEFAGWLSAASGSGRPPARA
jgi:EAL domain-containing protein (putative c-di-GMP-specific phosphodiesterase class I)